MNDDINDALDAERESILSALHDRIGVCGHCGKKLCAGKQSNSQLPKTIPRDVLIDVMDPTTRNGKWEGGK